jgi:hypothetical protein
MPEASCAKLLAVSCSVQGPEMIVDWTRLFGTYVKVGPAANAGIAAIRAKDEVAPSIAFLIRNLRGG